MATGEPLHAGAGGVDVGIVGPVGIVRPRQRVGVGIIGPSWNC